MAMRAESRGYDDVDEGGFCLPQAPTHVQMKWKEEVRAGYEAHCRRTNQVPEPCEDCGQHWCVCSLLEKMDEVNYRIDATRLMGGNANPKDVEELENLTKQFDEQWQRPHKVSLDADQHVKAMNIANIHHTPTEEQPTTEPNCERCELARSQDPNTKERSDTVCNECECKNRNMCKQLHIKYDVAHRKPEPREDIDEQGAPPPGVRSDLELPSQDDTWFLEMYAHFTNNPHGAVGEPVANHDSVESPPSPVSISPQNENVGEVIESYHRVITPNSPVSTPQQHEAVGEVGGSDEQRDLPSSPPVHQSQAEYVPQSVLGGHPQEDIGHSWPPPVVTTDQEVAIQQFYTNYTIVVHYPVVVSAIVDSEETPAAVDIDHPEEDIGGCRLLPDRDEDEPYESEAFRTGGRNFVNPYGAVGEPMPRSNGQDAISSPPPSPPADMYQQHVVVGEAINDSDDSDEPGVAGEAIDDFDEQGGALPWFDVNALNDGLDALLHLGPPPPEEISPQTSVILSICLAFFWCIVLCFYQGASPPETPAHTTRLLFGCDSII